jgi:hypothetical protein
MRDHFLMLKTIKVFFGNAFIRVQEIVAILIELCEELLLFVHMLILVLRDGMKIERFHI